MKKTIISESIGVFTYKEERKVYELEKEGKRWSLLISFGQEDAYGLLKKAENLFVCLAQFDQKAKRAIAEKLVDYKNEFWPEYDEDDEELDWDAVDAGEYDITEEAFAEAIFLCDIQVGTDMIYCEYNDGDLFGGHRIHAFFDNDYKLISTDV